MKKTKASFALACDVLHNAWFSHLIRPSDCAGCFVATLLREHAGIRLDDTADAYDLRWQTEQNYRWYSVVTSFRNGDKKAELPPVFQGYLSVEDIHELEAAFEKAVPGELTHEASVRAQLLEPEVLAPRFQAAITVLGRLHKVTDEALQQQLARFDCSQAPQPVDVKQLSAYMLRELGTEDDF